MAPEFLVASVGAVVTLEFMASFGHVAVGLLAGRIHGGTPNAAPGKRCCSTGTLATFTLLALLPDFDVALVALGMPDAGCGGHRGASHSFATAVIIGLMVALAARRLGWPMLRTSLAATAAVGSHAVLDLLGHGGRGLPLFWPLSLQRFHSPWRILPDAPRGLGLLSGPGLVNVGIELALFLPLITYAVWPNIRPALSPLVEATLAAVPARWRRRPNLTVVTGGPTPAPELRATAPSVPAPAATPVPLPVPVAVPVAGALPHAPATGSDPPLRSSG